MATPTMFGGGDRPGRWIRLTRKVDGKPVFIAIESFVSVEPDTANDTDTIVKLAGGFTITVDEPATTVMKRVLALPEV